MHRSDFERKAGLQQRHAAQAIPSMGTDTHLRAS
jgi:hypothetical protein